MVCSAAEPERGRGSGRCSVGVLIIGVSICFPCFHVNFITLIQISQSKFQIHWTISLPHPEYSFRIQIILVRRIAVAVLVVINYKRKTSSVQAYSTTSWVNSHRWKAEYQRYNQQSQVRYYCLQSKIFSGGEWVMSWHSFPLRCGGCPRLSANITILVSNVDTVGDWSHCKIVVLVKWLSDIVCGNVVLWSTWSNNLSICFACCIFILFYVPTNCDNRQNIINCQHPRLNDLQTEFTILAAI